MVKKKIQKENVVESADVIKPVTREKSRRNKGLAQLKNNLSQEVLESVDSASINNMRLGRRSTHKSAKTPQPPTHPADMATASAAATDETATNELKEAEMPATTNKLKHIIIDGSDVALS
jgi:hypothetical protein